MLGKQNESMINSQEQSDKSGLFSSKIYFNISFWLFEWDKTTGNISFEQNSLNPIENQAKIEIIQVTLNKFSKKHDFIII